uniref:Helicase with zinc finger 2 n=1 Tax=Salmo trutta TaxID=8032 RepID=A0A674BIW7_SALTR
MLCLLILDKTWDHAMTTKERIQRQFPGKFMELCETCFHHSPRKISYKGNSSKCNSTHRHVWKATLVLCDNKNTLLYEEVRPLPFLPHLNSRSWLYCKYVKKGEQCSHGAHRCWFAHSVVEMTVWNAESQEGFVRAELLPAVQPVVAAASLSQTQHYCKACNLWLSSWGGFQSHLNTFNHMKRTNEYNNETTTEWKYRDPPQTNQTYKLCERRASTCELGSNCVDAHSAEELQEWRTRDKTDRKTVIAAEEQGLLSYQDNLLRENRDRFNKAIIVRPFLLNIYIYTTRPLAHVALLKQEPGASFSLDENSPEPCTYSTGEPFCNSDMTYDITVSFKSNNPGLYEQWLVFDFDTRPVLLQKLKVNVGKEPSIQLVAPPEDDIHPSLNQERWHQGNRDIIPYMEKTEAQEKLLKEYQPQICMRYKPHDCNMPINHQNYKERMHSFLYTEEQAEDQVVSRLNVQTTITLSVTLEATVDDPQFGMKIAPLGELFCAVSVPYNLTPDIPEGLMLRRSIQSALIAPVSSDNQSHKVYEAIILKDTTSKNKMHLKLSERCCSDLKLQKNETCEMEVQFQLNRLKFCEMHQAIDLLPDTERVLPDFSNCIVPVSKTQQNYNLNAKQQAAMEFIIGDTDGGGSVSPLLIYGPFGTGKTLTLATAAKELVRQPHTRVLICTLTNSSADLYVKGHFHESVNSGDLEIKPLRIKAEESSVQSTDEITLQYCHRSKNGQFFSLPDKDTVDSCRVVITTTAMARHLHDLKLPGGYFTHILIDEASQMLECEALMALGLAGPVTRVVLAGDHMQMGPKLFSVDDDQRSNHTLLNRLFHHYQAQESSAALKSRIIFNENYRSTKEIVEFVSTNFYVGKSDAIKAVGNVPAHPNCHPLRFHHVRGESHLDTTSMSWFNREEVASVVEVVQNLLRDWPPAWGNQDQSSICVLSEGCQVSLIRKELRKKRHGQVTVENIANVQGKQFRAIVLTAVQTRDSLLSSDSLCHEFFNDARVLNTVMTRAQSQVVVVGDAAALCYFGKSSRIWKAYIDHCISKNSADPQTLTEDYLKQEVREISKFVKGDEEDNSDSDSSISEIPDIDDPILRELLDEGKDVRVTVTADGLLGITQGEPIVNPINGLEMNTSQDSSPLYLQALIKRDPSIYKHCHLSMERFDAGYAIPLEEPSLRISIKGRKNIGRSFPGDQVVVEILDNECHPPNGKVLDVVKVENASMVFVCTIDNYDNQVMTPINNCVSKIYTPFWRDKPNYIAVRKLEDLRVEEFVKINEESKRNNLFVVKVLKWREQFRYPLGVVVKVLPKVASLDSGLEVLDIEYQLTRATSVEKDHEILKELNTDTQNRKHYQEFITFTIDPAHSKDLDDAISVRDVGQHYEIGVHIADVASLVTKDSLLDKNAQQNGTAFYPPGKEPVYMFPLCLSTKYFSLLPGCERNAISLMVKIDKKTDRIKTSKFSLSKIKSDRKLSYEEAENIIQNSDVNDQRYDTLEGCLAKACHFSEVHRKDRKQEDWHYKSPDDDVIVGRRRSHKMVEELMVMFNHAVTELLLKDAKTVSCTPVRCQDKPNTEKLCQLKDKYSSLIPLSIHFCHCIDQIGNTFSLLTSIVRSLESAFQDKDIPRIVDLIATDDIHPQLLPLIIELRKTIHRAYVLRSNSTYLSRVGHYDLQLESYTWASSPIRRYVDVIVQRLLHSVLENKAVRYTSLEIDQSCLSFSRKSEKQKMYERKAHCLSFASQLNNQSAQKIAFVIDASPAGNSLRVYFPFNRSSMPEDIPIMYRDLQLTDQPEFNEHNNHVVLKWKRRVYSFTNENIHAELQQQSPHPFVTSVPTDLWKGMLSALKEENLDIVTNPNPGHYIELPLRVKSGETLKVQLGTDTQRGLLIPVVQMLVVRNKFEICLEHSKDPTLCFSKYALHSSKKTYTTYQEYQKIWKPLCEMESASNAVTENDSIVLEDVPLTWKQIQKESQLGGFFQLSLEKMKQWAIEYGLKHSFLCIRMRYQNRVDLSNNGTDDDQHVDLSNIPSLIWVAHGITTGVTDEDEAKKLSYVQIDFRINHMSIAKIPERVFGKDTRFTVELIPKLLPDVRKEAAVDNLTQANELVKNISLGKRTNSGRYTYSALQKYSSPLAFFQFCCITTCTGKTVVGVHLVYWFFLQNQKDPNHLRPKAAGGSSKRRCILYCGPSNKSVDVVAGQLLKLRKVLRPLRVYSEQMEMLEFPYPGSNLKLSRRSIREERPKRELSSITLHHLIRMTANPFSNEIIHFDARIQRGEDLTDKEIESYKVLLSHARNHELMRHDVILCTCTAASNPNFYKLDLKQIIIDECAMATEPEQGKVIYNLFYDYQLQPITHSDLSARLGMRKSLFERYMEKALMLDTQYRMHKRICEFPSKEFYNGILKTGATPKDSVLLAQSHHLTPILFGHVYGKEISLVVSTERGNENSKANSAEAEESVRIASLLIKHAGVAASDIAILTPYNAQVAKVNETLLMKHIQNVNVNTITKSQGSEWRYVILSTVRSCPKSEIDTEPTKAWLTKKLGFVMDPNQVNVGITRAQEGLCIIGKKLFQVVLYGQCLSAHLVDSYQAPL